MASATTGVLLLTQEHWGTVIAGLPLLHRVLLSGKKAGLQGWVVLCCTEAEAIQQSLAKAARLRNISYQVHDLQTLPRAHLTTLLPPDDLLVVTTPAAFDYRLLAALQESSMATLGVTVRPERTQEQVGVLDGYVTLDLAKTQTRWCSTGLLRCAGTVLGQALCRSWEAMTQASAPATALLAGCLAQTTLAALDIRSHVWIPLDEPGGTSVPEAETQLLRSLGRAGDSLFVRLVDRRISQAITRRLMHTAIRPNQITLCSALIGLSGAWLLAQPAYLWQVVGSLCFLLSTIIDGCDGEIARLTFQESEFGAKLDVLMDNVVHVFLFPSIALGLYRQEYDQTYLFLGGLALLGIIVSMVVFLPYVWRRQTQQSTLARLHEQLASRDFAYVLPVLAVCHKLDWFLWATTIGTYLFAVAWVVIVARIQRQQRLVSDEHPSAL